MLSSLVFAAKHIVQYYPESEGVFDVEIGEFKADFANLSDDQMRKFEKNSEVKKVQENGFIEAYGGVTTEDTKLWGLDRIDSHTGLNGKYVYPENAGEGVTVYVVDTGTTVQHIEFEGRASWGFDSTGEGFVDTVGHGTHVAATIAGKSFGVAKKATIIAVKTLTLRGGTEETVIKGLQWVVNDFKTRKTKAIINMSLGGRFSKVLNDAVEAVVSSGVHVIVAAGNDNKDACGYSPASASTVVTVGATDKKDFKASFSNWGKCIDLHAPGVDILSAWKGNGNRTNTISGTSMSAPHVVF